MAITAKARRMRMGGGRGHEPHSDWSDKKITCIGDLEGQWPFDSIDLKMDTQFPKNSGDRNIFNKDAAGFISIDLTDSDALVFTGDLIDHGEYDIRWLMAFKKLHEIKPNHVKCCIGNRDFNKIRMIDECFIVDSSSICIFDKLTPDTDLHEFITGIQRGWGTNYMFAYNYDKINKRFQNWKIPPSNTPADFSDVYDSDPTKRITQMFKDTMGITEVDEPDGNYRVKELSLLYPSKSRKDLNKLSSLYICVTNMIMAVKWNDVTNKPSWFKDLNGLYIDYISNGYIITSATINLNDTACFSHAGIPASMSAPLGFGKNPDKSYDVNQSSKINHHLRLVHHEKQLFVMLYNHYWNAIKNTLEMHDNYIDIPSLDPLFHKYVELTCAAINYGSSIQNVGYNFAPMVQRNYDPLFPTVKNNGFAGGNWYDSPPETANIYTIDPCMYKYNIYGHSPQGPLPTVRKLNDSYYICLDISVVGKTKSGYSNGYIRTGAFTYLTIHNNGSPTITGRMTENVRGGLMATGITLPVDYKYSLDEFIRYKSNYTWIQYHKLGSLKVGGQRGHHTAVRKSLDDCTVPELKERAFKRGIKVTGLKKAEIIAKLRRR